MRQLTKEEQDDIRWVGDGSDLFELVEEGDWDVDVKYQLMTHIVREKATGKLFRWGIQRSGSPFSDYEYYRDDYIVEVKAVEEVVTTITYVDV